MEEIENIGSSQINNHLSENDIQLLSMTTNAITDVLHCLLDKFDSIREAKTAIKIKEIESNIKELEISAEKEKWKIQKEILFEYFSFCKTIFENKIIALKENKDALKNTIDRLLNSCDENIHFYERESSQVAPGDIRQKDSYFRLIEHLQSEKNKLIYDLKDYLISQDKIIASMNTGIEGFLTTSITKSFGV